jgi:hypothetical protein
LPSRCLALVVVAPAEQVVVRAVLLAAVPAVLLPVVPKVDQAVARANPLDLPIVRRHHPLMAEASNVCLSTKRLIFKPTEEWFSAAQLEPH